MILRIDSTGTVWTLYGEEIDLGVLGLPSIRRASRVEPDSEGHWWANLSPIGGPVQGPFHHRSQALQAEQQWLVKHWLLR